MNCATSSTTGSCRCTQRACNNRSRVQRSATAGARLSPPRLHSRTAQQTSTTLSKYCSWRISVVKGTMGICICATTGMTTSSNVGPRLSSTVSKDFTHQQQRDEDENQSETMTTLLPTNMTKPAVISTYRARDKPRKPTRD